jgi:hypothetical protein
MAEINRIDIIEEGAINAPLELAANLKTAMKEVEGFVAAFRKIGTEGGGEGISKIKKETEQLTEAEKQLVAVQTQIVKATAKNNDEYRAQEKELIKLKKELKEKLALGERDARQLNKTNASVTELTAALGKNRRAYDELANAEQRASQEGQDLLKVIQQQDKEVKELKEETGRFQDNVGNYPKFLGAAKDAFNTLTPGIAGTASMLFTATKAALAFIATPLGAVIALLALAISPIIGFLRDTGDGMDLVEKKTTGLKTGLNVLRDEFNSLGAKMVDSNTSLGSFTKTLLMGNPIVLAFVASVKTLRAVFPQIAKDFDDAVIAGERYAEMMDEVTTAQEFFKVESAEEENIIKRLILQSKNRTLSEEERIALIDQALAKEQSLGAKRIGLATSLAAVEVEAAKQRTKIQREEDETLIQFGKRLATQLDKTAVDQRDRLLNSLKALEEARGEGIAIEEKLQNQRDALLDKADERDKKSAEDRLRRQVRIEEALFQLEVIRTQRAIDSASTIEERVAKELEMEDLRVKHLLSNENLLKEERAVIMAESEKRATDIWTKGIKDRLALREKELRDQLIIVKASFDKEEDAIQQQAIDGLITRKEADKQIIELRKRTSVELINENIRTLEQVLQLENLSAEERKKVEAELAAFRLKLTDEVYSQLEDKGNENVEKTRKQLETIRGIYSEFANALNNLFGSLTERRLVEVDKEEEALDKKTERELLLAGDNERAKAEILSKADKQREELEKKRIQAQRRAAAFEKATAIIQAGILTAINVLKVFPNPVLMALAAAIGAIQIAAIIAKPIPQYAVGVDSAPGGPAWVGERGFEGLVAPNGRVSLTPNSATLMNLQPGTEVIPHNKTMRLLALGAQRDDTLGTTADAAIGRKLLAAMEDNTKAISKIKTSTNNNLIESNGVAYRLFKQKEEFVKRSRAVAMGTWW